MATTISDIRGTRLPATGAPPRRKRSDTHVGTIERQYGVDFGVRSDMHLGTLLKRRSSDWLSDLLREDAEADQDREPSSEASEVGSRP
ncbi:MAG: hypothetical protein M3464_14165 [Chloroflexota bacterium]|nr:hypothetical protein [Chloroflexota bacterium]